MLRGDWCKTQGGKVSVGREKGETRLSGAKHMYMYIIKGSLCFRLVALGDGTELFIPADIITYL